MNKVTSRRLTSTRRRSSSSPARTAACWASSKAPPRSVQIAHLKPGICHVEHEFSSLAIVVDERRRPAQQVGSGVLVIPSKRAHTGRVKSLTGAHAQRGGQLIVQAKLQPIAVRLLQVVRDDFLVLEQAIPGDPFQPVGEAGVEIGALLLGERRVRRVPHQEVSEAEGLVAGRCRSIWPDELLADQGHQARPKLLAPLRWRKLGHRGALEDLADHRGPPDQVALERFQVVEPGRHQRRNAGRHRDGIKCVRRSPAAILPLQDALVDQHGNQLLHEQWIALGRLADPLLDGLRQL